jgi:hypothetical protein
MIKLLAESLSLLFHGLTTDYEEIQEINIFILILFTSRELITCITVTRKKGKFIYNLGSNLPPASKF